MLEVLESIKYNIATCCFFIILAVRVTTMNVIKEHKFLDKGFNVRAQNFCQPTKKELRHVEPLIEFISNLIGMVNLPTQTQTNNTKIKLSSRYVSQFLLSSNCETFFYKKKSIIFPISICTKKPYSYTKALHHENA